MNGREDIHKIRSEADQIKDFLSRFEFDKIKRKTLASTTDASGPQGYWSSEYSTTTNKISIITCERCHGNGFIYDDDADQDVPCTSCKVAISGVTTTMWKP